MPYKLWHYLVKIVVPILGITYGITFFLPENDLLRSINRVAFYLVAGIAAIGAFMGILLVFGPLKMRCPFCKESGPIGGSEEEGMWMECPSCGWIHTRGMFGFENPSNPEGREGRPRLCRSQD